MHAHVAVAVPLTTGSGPSPGRGPAVERSPVGESASRRTVEVAHADAAGRAAVVQHGADLDGSGAHGGDTMAAPDPSLPQEATVLAACGTPTAASVVPDGPDQGAGPGGAVRAGAPAGRRPAIAAEG
ncbi:hypothetical protein [uncultured Pseudokineococcus sp.]|uniref:hypothetical protein n=1 Tax=uncultured Pseudokineococcus sp. TaxID=1642928 RepID=UPI00262178D9|nr:hypothetical protein [uncultured Pseudokineococcus sp.]